MVYVRTQLRDVYKGNQHQLREILIFFIQDKYEERVLENIERTNGKINSKSSYYQICSALASVVSSFLTCR